MPARAPSTAPGPTPEDTAAQEEEPGLDAQAIAGWVITGVGAAGLVAGIVTGILALDKHNQLGQVCPQRTCEPAYHGEVDAFETLRTTSTATLLAGGVVLLTGLTLLVTAGDETPAASADRATATSSSPALRISLTPGGLVAQGVF